MTKVRTRFAPSPTGNLHIGGARTALYSYLYAKANDGVFVLRIEDTDQQRSEKKYEERQIENLKWLGIIHDEGPGKDGGFGPYRQSERFDLYKQIANDLVEKDLAFPCFCTEKELEEKKELAEKEGREPHYDGTCRKLSMDERVAKTKDGIPHTVRFKVPKKAYQFNDLVRGDVKFPEGMVGDFVILRSEGSPVYNFCCVIDDWKMEITHVIRADDHTNNTLRQLMIYEALDAKPPVFAHVSLLVGKDRQKLSKRHGATSVDNYVEASYLPSAMINYLSLLGWSHPEEKNIFDMDELIRVFDLDRFSKSPAVFDQEKFDWVNGQHLRKLTGKEMLKAGSSFINESSPYHKMTDSWKERVMELLKEKIEFFNQLNEHLEAVFRENIDINEKLKEIYAWETSPVIYNYVKKELSETDDGLEFLPEGTFAKWSGHLKKEEKIKGKNLFMGMRTILTGSEHGPDLGELIELTPAKIIKNRIKQLEEVFGA